MKIITSWDELPPKALKEKFALTIGTFDGVHKGHQALLKRLLSYKVPTAVLTFSGHPLHFLRPPAPMTITKLETKLSLLEALGIDYAIVLHFQDVVDLPFDQFLNKLPLSHLLLGKKSAFGQGRQGTEENVRKWATDKNVHLEYIDQIDQISSTQIRAALQSGDRKKAEQLLGHNLYERYSNV